jgi:CNT family concentrative nucleoside transporter
MDRLISLFGLVVMIGLAWLLGRNRFRISLRIIVGGLILQLAFGAVILRTPVGTAAISGANDAFLALNRCVDEGSRFVFGKDFMSQEPVLKSFAFRALPTIIAFSSLMAVLYHFGIMQWIVKWMAWVMQWTLGTSGAESLSAAANIFLGQTEAPLSIRPYLPLMTRSELMAVMVGGFANISGGVLAAFAGMGINAGHLLAASVISAPASLLIAKILEPEVDVPKTLGQVDVRIPRTSVNVIDAAATGAADGVKLAINVAAMLIAFLALIAVVNMLLGTVGGWFGRPLSLEMILGWLFSPLAWLMGIPWKDCPEIGELLGIRMIGNEFISYEKLAEWMADTGPLAPQLDPRSQVIATYALCGFANVGSIGIQIGGIGPLAPERQRDLAQLGFRAMLGGTLSTFMTACVAGLFV